MTLFWKLFLVVIVAMPIIDGIWLGVVTRSFYSAHIGHLFGDFKMAPAIVFYLMYAAALVYFVIQPHAGESLAKIFLTGAFFGLAAYGAYDLTNQATIKDWPLVVTVADMAWGAFVSGLLSALATSVASRFF